MSETKQYFNCLKILLPLLIVLGKKNIGSTCYSWAVANSTCKSGAYYTCAWYMCVQPVTVKKTQR